MKDHTNKIYISVVMPVYNGARFLKDAIDSVINQSFKQFELIIINDGSTDSSEEIINSYNDQRIIYVKNIENFGLVRSLNIGLKLCKGKYIARFDSDDVCLPQRFEKQLSYMEENEQCVVVGSLANIINENNKFLGTFELPENHDEILKGMVFTNQIIHPAVMLRKSIIDDLNAEYDSQFKHVEDYAFWLKLIKAGQFYNIQEPLVNYRIHGNNISVIHSEEQYQTSLSLRNQLCLDLGIKIKLEVFDQLEKDIKNNKANLPELVNVFFEQLGSEFYTSEVVSKIYWQSQIKLKIAGYSVSRKYATSLYNKKIIWSVILLLTPIFARLPKALFTKRLRIFNS